MSFKAIIIIWYNWIMFWCFPKIRHEYAGHVKADLTQLSHVFCTGNSCVICFNTHLNYWDTSWVTMRSLLTRRNTALLQWPAPKTVSDIQYICWFQMSFVNLWIIWAFLLLSHLRIRLENLHLEGGDVTSKLQFCRYCYVFCVSSGDVRHIKICYSRMWCVCI